MDSFQSVRLNTSTLRKLAILAYHIQNSFIIMSTKEEALKLVWEQDEKEAKELLEAAFGKNVHNSTKPQEPSLADITAMFKAIDEKLIIKQNNNQEGKVSPKEDTEIVFVNLPDQKLCGQDKFGFNEMNYGATALNNRCPIEWVRVALKNLGNPNNSSNCYVVTLIARAFELGLLNPEDKVICKQIQAILFREGSRGYSDLGEGVIDTTHPLENHSIIRVAKELGLLSRCNLLIYVSFKKSDTYHEYEIYDTFKASEYRSSSIHVPTIHLGLRNNHWRVLVPLN